MSKSETAEARARIEKAKRIVFRHLFPQHPYYTECEMELTLEREQDSDRQILPSTVLAAVTEALASLTSQAQGGELREAGNRLAAQARSYQRGFSGTIDLGKALNAWDKAAMLSAIPDASPGMEENDDEAKRDKWSEFEDDYLTDGNDGWVAAPIIKRCRSAFDAAWPGGAKNAFDAAYAALPKALASAPTAERLRSALAGINSLIGNVDHSRGGGSNTAQMYGDMLNSIRDIARAALDQPQSAEGAQ